MRWLPLVLLVWTGLAWLVEPPALVAALPPVSGDALVLQLSDAPLPLAPDRVLQSGDTAGRTAALPSEPVTLPVLVTKVSNERLPYTPPTPVLSVIAATGYLYCYAALISLAVAGAIKLASVGLRRE